MYLMPYNFFVWQRIQFEPEETYMKCTSLTYSKMPVFSMSVNGKEMDFLFDSGEGKSVIRVEEFDILSKMS